MSHSKLHEIVSMFDFAFLWTDLQHYMYYNVFDEHKSILQFRFGCSYLIGFLTPSLKDWGICVYDDLPMYTLFTILCPLLFIKSNQIERTSDGD